MRLRTAILFALTLVLALLPACKKDDSATRLSADEADKLNAQRSSFETASDPPFAAQTWFAAGQLAESQQAWPKAIEAYQNALKVDARHLLSMYRLGVLLVQAQRFPDAITMWKRYIEASNGDAAGYSNLGFCYDLANRPVEAEKAYLEALKKDPKFETCRVNYGLLLARSGRASDAVAQLQQVLEPAQVHYNLGSVYEQQGKTNQARAEYRKALELDPQFLPARSRLMEMGSDPQPR